MAQFFGDEIGAELLDAGDADNVVQGYADLGPILSAAWTAVWTYFHGLSVSVYTFISSLSWTSILGLISGAILSLIVAIVVWGDSSVSTSVRGSHVGIWAFCFFVFVQIIAIVVGIMLDPALVVPLVWRPFGNAVFLTFSVMCFGMFTDWPSVFLGVLFSAYTISLCFLFRLEDDLGIYESGMGMSIGAIVVKLTYTFGDACVVFVYALVLLYVKFGVGLLFQATRAPLLPVVQPGV